MVGGDTLNKYCLIAPLAGLFLYIYPELQTQNSQRIIVVNLERDSLHCTARRVKNLYLEFIVIVYE